MNSCLRPQNLQSAAKNYKVIPPRQSRIILIRIIAYNTPLFLNDVLLELRAVSLSEQTLCGGEETKPN